MTMDNHEQARPTSESPASGATPPNAAPAGGHDMTTDFASELVPTMDRLIARIADAEADEHDWGTFEALAGTQPQAWKALACAQRDAALLAEAVLPAIDASERVRLRRSTSATLSASGSDRTARNARRSDAEFRYGPDLRRIGGWAIAAVIGLAWLGSMLAPEPRAIGPTNTNTAGILPTGWTINTPEDAVRAYLDVGSKSGRVLGEMPDRVIVRTTPTGGSTNGDDPQQIEVIYLRQFVERAVISEFFELGSDEFGRPVPIRLSIPPQPRPESWQ